MESRFRRCFIIFCSIAALSFSIGCAKGCGDSSDVSNKLKISALKGDVKVKSGENVSDAEIGRELITGDVIISGNRSYADISYQQDKVIRIYERSSAELLVPGQADPYPEQAKTDTPAKKPAPVKKAASVKPEKEVDAVKKEIKKAEEKKDKAANAVSNIPTM